MNFHRKAAAKVVDRAGLVSAIEAGLPEILIDGRIGDLPSLVLRPGQTLSAHNRDAVLVFSDDGLAVTAQNMVRNVSLVCEPDRRAVHVAPHRGDRGAIILADLVCSGQLQLIFGDESDAAELRLEGLGVANCDTAGRDTIPTTTGRLLQGAVTVWNAAARATTIRLSGARIDIGNANRPAIGSGMVIAGAPAAGRVDIKDLGLGAIHVDSLPATPGFTTRAGGIVVCDGVEVLRLGVAGPVVARGSRCSAMWNSGQIATWHLSGTACTHGPFSPGLASEGRIGRLDGGGAVETFGAGSAACALDGVVGHIGLRKIRTLANGSPGVEISGRVDALEVTDGISTVGDPGRHLAGGDMTRIPADGVRIRATGRLGRLVTPRVQSTGQEAMPLRNEGMFG